MNKLKFKEKGCENIDSKAFNKILNSKIRKNFPLKNLMKKF